MVLAIDCRKSMIARIIQMYIIQANKNNDSGFLYLAPDDCSIIDPTCDVCEKVGASYHEQRSSPNDSPDSNYNYINYCTLCYTTQVIGASDTTVDQPRSNNTLAPYNIIAKWFGY